MVPGGGAFHSPVHIHEFQPVGTGTLMRDTFAYSVPLGPLGRLFDKLVLERYLRRFLEGRLRALKEAAEAPR